MHKLLYNSEYWGMRKIPDQRKRDRICSKLEKKKKEKKRKRVLLKVDQRKRLEVNTII